MNEKTEDSLEASCGCSFQTKVQKFEKAIHAAHLLYHIYFFVTLLHSAQLDYNRVVQDIVKLETVFVKHCAAQNHMFVHKYGAVSLTRAIILLIISIIPSKPICLLVLHAFHAFLKL